MLRYPGPVKPGSVFEFPISAIDVMPTLLGLAGVEIPDTVQGVDLSPYIRSQKGDPPESVLFMNPCTFEIGDDRGPDQYPTYNDMQLQYRGIRTSRYTYVRTIEGPWLLYDNEQDPYQMNNLINQPDMKSVQEKLEVMLQKHLEHTDDDIRPNEAYYEMFDLDIDHRGKLKAIVENPYDRKG